MADDDQRVVHLSNGMLSAFANLLGRIPTEAEKLELYRIKNVLGIPDNDPVWLLLVVHVYFKDYYKKIPGEVEGRINKAFEKGIQQIVALQGVHPGSASVKQPFYKKFAISAAVGVSILIVLVGSLAKILPQDHDPDKLADLIKMNRGVDVFSTCFNGAGRVEEGGGGKSYCIPQSKDGQVFGWVIREKE